MSSSFNNRKFKGGAYTTALSILVIVVILVINLIVSGVFRSKDLTATGQYSLNKDTIEYLKNYDTPIDMYYVCEVGQEMKMLQSVAENFAAKGTDFSMAYKDPVQYPQFVMQYMDNNGIGQNINSNSIILINRNNPDLYAYVDRDSMINYEYSTEDFETTYISSYCAEAALIRALSQVADTAETVVYVATGHGEQLISETGMISQSIVDLLELNSYTAKTIDLKTTAIPEDCGALLLIGMINDMTQAESDKVKNYLTEGGRVAWFLSYAGVERPVQKALLNYYGLTYEELLLCEGDARRTEDEKPAMVLSAKTGTKNSGWALGVGVSKIAGARNTIEIEAQYLTSNQAYLTSNFQDPVYRQGDEKGTFALLTKVSETYRGNTGIMYVFNTQYFLADRYITKSSAFENGTIFVNALADMCDKEGAISIPDKAAKEEALIMNTQQKRTLLTILVGVIPGIVLLLGITVFIMRRR
ncbi:MAG: Gldg family protein [Lachnospiraceae bacterium]|nr:Gldg family protein [Lachnospiraceae bacterium]